MTRPFRTSSNANPPSPLRHMWARLRPRSNSDSAAIPGHSSKRPPARRTDLIRGGEGAGFGILDRQGIGFPEVDPYLIPGTVNISARRNKGSETSKRSKRSRLTTKSRGKGGDLVSDPVREHPVTLPVQSSVSSESEEPFSFLPRRPSSRGDTPPRHPYLHPEPARPCTPSDELDDFIVEDENYFSEEGESDYESAKSVSFFEESIDEFEGLPVIVKATVGAEEREDDDDDDDYPARPSSEFPPTPEPTPTPEVGRGRGEDSEDDDDGDQTLRQSIRSGVKGKEKEQRRPSPKTWGPGHQKSPSRDGYKSSKHSPSDSYEHLSPFPPHTPPPISDLSHQLQVQSNCGTFGASGDRGEVETQTPPQESVDAKREPSSDPLPRKTTATMEEVHPGDMASHSPGRLDLFVPRPTDPRDEMGELQTTLDAASRDRLHGNAPNPHGARIPSSGAAAAAAPRSFSSLPRTSAVAQLMESEPLGLVNKGRTIPPVASVFSTPPSVSARKAGEEHGAEDRSAWSDDEGDGRGKGGVRGPGGASSGLGEAGGVRVRRSDPRFTLNKEKIKFGSGRVKGKNTPSPDSTQKYSFEDQSGTGGIGASPVHSRGRQSSVGTASSVSSPLHNSGHSFFSTMRHPHQHSPSNDTEATTPIFPNSAKVTPASDTWSRYHSPSQPSQMAPGSLAFTSMSLEDRFAYRSPAHMQSSPLLSRAKAMSDDPPILHLPNDQTRQDSFVANLSMAPISSQERKHLAGLGLGFPQGTYFFPNPLLNSKLRVEEDLGPDHPWSGVNKSRVQSEMVKFPTFAATHPETEEIRNDQLAAKRGPRTSISTPDLRQIALAQEREKKSREAAIAPGKSPRAEAPFSIPVVHANASGRGTPKDRPQPRLVYSVQPLGPCEIYTFPKPRLRAKMVETRPSLDRPDSLFNVAIPDEGKGKEKEKDADADELVIQRADQDEKQLHRPRHESSSQRVLKENQASQLERAEWQQRARPSRLSRRRRHSSSASSALMQGSRESVMRRPTRSTSARHDSDASRAISRKPSIKALIHRSSSLDRSAALKKDIGKDDRQSVEVGNSFGWVKVRGGHGNDGAGHVATKEPHGHRRVASHDASVQTEDVDVWVRDSRHSRGRSDSEPRLGAFGKGHEESPAKRSSSLSHRRHPWVSHHRAASEGAPLLPGSSLEQRPSTEGDASGTCSKALASPLAQRNVQIPPSKHHLLRQSFEATSLPVPDRDSSSSASASASASASPSSARPRPSPVSPPDSYIRSLPAAPRRRSSNGGNLSKFVSPTPHIVLPSKSNSSLRQRRLGESVAIPLGPGRAPAILTPTLGAGREAFIDGERQESAPPSLASALASASEQSQSSLTDPEPHADTFGFDGLGIEQAESEASESAEVAGSGGVASPMSDISMESRQSSGHSGTSPSLNLDEASDYNDLFFRPPPSRPASSHLSHLFAGLGPGWAERSPSDDGEEDDDLQIPDTASLHIDPASPIETEYAGSISRSRPIQNDREGHQLAIPPPGTPLRDISSRQDLTRSQIVDQMVREHFDANVRPGDRRGTADSSLQNTSARSTLRPPSITPGESLAWPPAYAEDESSSQVEDPPAGGPRRRSLVMPSGDVSWDRTSFAEDLFRPQVAYGRNDRSPRLVNPSFDDDDDDVAAGEDPALLRAARKVSIVPSLAGDTDNESPTGMVGDGRVPHTMSGPNYLDFEDDQASPKIERLQESFLDLSPQDPSFGDEMRLALQEGSPTEGFDSRSGLREQPSTATIRVRDYEDGSDDVPPLPTELETSESVRPTAGSSSRESSLRPGSSSGSLQVSLPSRSAASLEQQSKRSQRPRDGAAGGTLELRDSLLSLDRPSSSASVLSSLAPLDQFPKPPTERVPSHRSLSTKQSRQTLRSRRSSLPNFSKSSLSIGHDRSGLDERDEDAYGGRDASTSSIITPEPGRSFLDIDPASPVRDSRYSVPARPWSGVSFISMLTGPRSPRTRRSRTFSDPSVFSGMERHRGWESPDEGKSSRRG